MDKDFKGEKMKKEKNMTLREVCASEKFRGMCMSLEV